MSLLAGHPLTISTLKRTLIMPKMTENITREYVSQHVRDRLIMQETLLGECKCLGKTFHQINACTRQMVNYEVIVYSVLIRYCWDGCANIV